MTASLLLFKFPSLIHKKKKLKFKPKHISHRGGAAENLENTITAFKHALDQHTEMLELDCHITRDGEVVVSHDNSLLRVCNTKALITDTDYQDLPKIKSGLNVDFQPNCHVQGCDDRTIPTLREVFKAFPNTPINIDIKIDDDELITKVNELIREFNREDLCIWGSRTSTVVDKLYQLNPDIPVFFSIRRVLVLLLWFYTGLLPFIPLKEAALEIIMPSLALKSVDGSTPWANTWRSRFIVRLLDRLMMRPSLFRHLEQRGIQTYLWVLNEEQDWDRAFKLGVAGVMTDFPSKLKDYLALRPEVATRV